MSNKRKFVIQPHYEVIVIALLFGVFNWLIPPSPHMYHWSKEITTSFVVTVLLIWGRHYTFSDKGVKVYLLGIRIRNIPWSIVKRLILFNDQTAKKKNAHGRFLVVEMLGCIPSFPEKGSAGEVSTFFFKNLTCAIKIRLKESKWQTYIEKIEEFHKIDAVYTWESK